MSEVLVPIEGGCDNFVSQLIRRVEAILEKEHTFRDIAVYGTTDEPLYKFNDVYLYLYPDAIVRHIARVVTGDSTAYKHNIDYIFKSILTPQKTSLGNISVSPRPTILITISGLVQVFRFGKGKFADLFTKLITNNLKYNYQNDPETMNQTLDQIQETLAEEEKNIEEPLSDIRSGVYLVQPAVLQNTSRYKFGMATTNVDRRIKNYKVGTIILCKYYCENPVPIEDALKIAFQDKIYSGNEYIEHDNKQEMITAFQEVVARFISITN